MIENEHHKRQATFLVSANQKLLVEYGVKIQQQETTLQMFMECRAKKKFFFFLFKVIIKTVETKKKKK